MKEKMLGTGQQWVPQQHPGEMAAWMGEGGGPTRGWIPGALGRANGTPQRRWLWEGGEGALLVQSLSHVPLFQHMDCSVPGFLVLHYLLHFAQTHVH